MSCATFNITLATSESTAFPLDGAVPLQVVVEKTSFDLEMLSTGPRGTSATVAVGAVTASAPGSQPSITNSGTPLMAVLDFVLPRGEQGPQGIQGSQGVQGIQGIQGPTGQAATVAVGSTTASESGGAALVTNSGTSSAAVLDFIIPRGEKGETGQMGPQGIQGAVGPGYSATSSTSMPAGAGTRTFVTQSGLAYLAGVNVKITSRSSLSDSMTGYVTSYSGTTLVVQVSGYTTTGQARSDWNISVAGVDGVTPTISIGNTNTGAPGSSAVVTNSGSAYAPILNFTIPSGLQGNTGPGYLATSTTTLISGTGQKAFFVGTGLAYVPGNYVKVVSASSPNDWMIGTVTGYYFGGLFIEVGDDFSTTAQNRSDWRITLTGSKGPQGAVGATGEQGPAGAGYAGTSSTSIDFASAPIPLVITTQAGLAYTVGTRIGLYSSQDASAYFQGVVTSYSGTTMSIFWDTGIGSGTVSSWNLSVAGDPGPAGNEGPAPAGTGLVSVTNGVLDTPTTLSARVAADAPNLRTQLGLGSLATQSSVSYGSLTGVPSSFTPASHASTHAYGGSDAISIEQAQVSGLATALANKAPLASPALTGTPTAPTQTAGDSSTKIATTAFVSTAISSATANNTIALMKFLE